MSDVDWEERNRRLVQRSTTLAVGALCALMFGLGTLVGGRKGAALVIANGVALVLFAGSMAVMEYANMLLRLRCDALSARLEDIRARRTCPPSVELGAMTAGGTVGKKDETITPAERWPGARIWFGNVVKCGRLSGGAAQVVIGITHLQLHGGHYFTCSVWRLGFYLTWFDAS